MENNCVLCDVVQVGDLLFFGYNVFIGFKKEIEVGDVFVSQCFVEKDDGLFGFEDVLVFFFEEELFVSDFCELYIYYFSMKLLQLCKFGGCLFVIFQIGVMVYDNKVLCWVVDLQGIVMYQDNCGECDYVFEILYDFEWIKMMCDDYVYGVYLYVDIFGEVFVEMVGGDLMVKVEDNIEDGFGIYCELVDDVDQSFDDVEVEYVVFGNFIFF